MFDPINCGKLPAQECRSFIDSLSRGTLTKDSTIVSRMFETKLLETLIENKCMNDKGELEMSKLKNKLQRRKIDVNVFNQMIAGGLTGTL